MFQIKNFSSIVASMINKIMKSSDELTDFNSGSVVRSIVEALASEIDEYYQSLLKGFYEAVPVAVYKSFSFNRQPAMAATGYVTFTRETGGTGEIVIPAGTRVSIPGESFSYITSANATLANGVDTIDALVSASITGANTNCLAASISQIVDTIDGIASVTNSLAFTSGSDEESNEERKLRFQQWLNTLNRSTNDAIQYGANTVKLYNSSGSVTEQVVKSTIYEPCVDDTPIGDPGIIYVYIWNGISGASAELIAETNKVLYGYTNDDGVKVAGWKPAGVVTTVRVITPTTVDVTAAVTLDGTRAEVDVDADIESAIGNFFTSIGIGKTLIFAELSRTIMGINGVSDVSFTTPTANVSAGGDYHICSLGTITITYP